MGSTTNGALGKIWTREAIICAIQRWAIEYGEPPISKVWASSCRPSGYPSTPTVRDRFGTWNNAITAAGFAPRPRGCPGHLDPEWTIERFAHAGRSR